MLDFYLIPDGSDVPEYPDEGLYLGSIDLAQHDLGLVFEAIGLEAPPPYFEDSRYSSSAVAALHASLATPKNGLSRESLNAFISILEKAISRGNGIVAFCD